MNHTEFIQDVSSGFQRLQQRYSKYGDFDNAVLECDSDNCFSVWFDILWYRGSVKQWLNSDGTCSVVTSFSRLTNDKDIVYRQEETVGTFLDAFPKQFEEYVRRIGKVVDVLDEFVKEQVLRRSVFFPPEEGSQSLVEWHGYIVYEDAQHHIVGADADEIKKYGEEILLHYWWNEDFNVDGFISEEDLETLWSDYWNCFLPDWAEE